MTTNTPLVNTDGSVNRLGFFLIINKHFEDYWTEVNMTSQLQGFVSGNSVTILEIDSLNQQWIHEFEIQEGEYTHLESSILNQD